MASPTSSGVFGFRPSASHCFPALAVIFVVVKKGEIPVIVMPCFLAATWELRNRPIMACLEATYADTPVPPKYPDVEATRTMDFRPVLSPVNDFIWCIASLRANLVSVYTDDDRWILTIQRPLDVYVNDFERPRRF
jgi:hypothetical protein